LSPYIDKFSNHVKNVLHGFFIALSTAIAEPSTVLPLIVNHFTQSSIIVGLFAALLRGGGIVVQLVAAFYAQSFAYVLKYIRRVFVIRFLSWFMIGVVILTLGDTRPTLTLVLMGFFLFLFSFSAGFGMIYFRELQGKMFTNKYRGYTMSYRQFFAALGAIISGGATAYVLETFPAPQSYGYLFIISSLLMSLGFIAFSTVDEPQKINTTAKEKKFRTFLKNALTILKNDRELKLQIVAQLFSYSYLIALPFYILDAKQSFEIDGITVGYFIFSQMLGAMLSNIIWAKLSRYGSNKQIIISALFLHLLALIIALFNDTFLGYFTIFFIVGMAMDGVRLGFQNQLLIIAPEDKRPIYVALNANITSLGLFLSILGGVILNYTNYQTLYITTILFLLISMISALQLRKET
jgi:MFS family permease